MISIDSINLDQMQALESTGQIVAITNLIDHDGDDTDDLEQAFCFICQLSDGQWLTGVVSDYTETLEVH